MNMLSNKLGVQVLYFFNFPSYVFSGCILLSIVVQKRLGKRVKVWFLTSRQGQGFLLLHGYYWFHPTQLKVPPCILCQYSSMNTSYLQSHNQLGFLYNSFVTMCCSWKTFMEAYF